MTLQFCMYKSQLWPWTKENLKVTFSHSNKSTPKIILTQPKLQKCLEMLKRRTDQGLKIFKT